MRNKLVLASLVLGVFLLHQDFWNWRKGDLVFGFLPTGLAYHAAYSVLAAALMAALVRYAWPKELDHVESELDNEDRAPKP